MDKPKDLTAEDLQYCDIKVLDGQLFISIGKPSAQWDTLFTYEEAKRVQNLLAQNLEHLRFLLVSSGQSLAPSLKLAKQE
jgi:hypothetical protein